MAGTGAFPQLGFIWNRPCAPDMLTPGPSPAALPGNSNSAKPRKTNPVAEIGSFRSIGPI